MSKITLVQGDCLEKMKDIPDGSVDCCVTSPPYYGLRDYGHDGQAGLENTPEEYIANMVKVFSEVKRVLRDDGTLWLNIGDSDAGSMKGIGANGKAYGGAKQQTNIGSIGIQEKPLKAHEIGLKNKDLIGIPWMLAFALRADGWYLRQEIIWHKPNPMPESVKDRCTKAHESIFLLSKKPKYYFYAEAIKEPCSESNVTDFKKRKTLDNKGKGNGTYEEARPDLCRGREAYMSPDFTRNKRSVWTVNTKPFKGAHFATFPTALIEPCVLAGCPIGGIVLDPFSGAATTGLVALQHGRDYIGIELNADYIKIAQARIDDAQKLTRI